MHHPMDPTTKPWKRTCLKLPENQGVPIPVDVLKLMEPQGDESSLASTIFQTLPERDRVALKLGRLIMTAMIEKKEGIRYAHRCSIIRYKSPKGAGLSPI